MSDFTDRELLLLSNSARERALCLLDAQTELCRRDYRDRQGRPATKEQIDQVAAGSEEHWALVHKIRELREINQ